MDMGEPDLGTLLNMVGQVKGQINTPPPKGWKLSIFVFDDVWSF